MIEYFSIPSRFNDINGILSFPEGEDRSPCVILSHGLISSKESSKYVALSEILVASGIAACRFDYHGCGDSGGRIEETTLTIRLNNLDAVVDYVRNKKCIDPERIGIVGSSFGSTTALLKKARDERIKTVSLWATPYLLEKEGDGNIDGIVFSDEIYNDFAGYDILSEAEKVSCAFVVHGSADETVPVQEGKAVYSRIKQPKAIEIVEGGDHVFSNPDHRDRVMKAALSWLKQFLG